MEYGKDRVIVKSIIHFVVKNKLAVWLLTILITFSGIFAGTRMKMETTPDISIPFLMVNTAYPGASPEQVMEDVSIPIEKSIENLEGIKAIYSSSHSNMSSIQVEYDYSKDMDDAKREVEDVLATVTLPENIDKPTISRISLNAMPVLAFSVTSSKEDITSLTSTVEDTILPSIESINGVASVSISGQHVEEVELTYDEKKMSKLGITESDVSELIQASDLAVSLGLFEFKDAEQAVAIDGKVTSIKDLKNMLIPVEPTAEHTSPFIKLGEIASIEVVGKVKSISRTNGEEAIAIQVVKAQEANTVTVVNEVKDIIDEHVKKIDGLIVDTTLDQAVPIEESIDTMINKALFGGAIAAFIILLFLRDLKSTIISIISIPVSIFIAILLLNWLDITLNIMTLGAVTVAIGRVIDDSIVVVENIYRRLHLKDEKLEGSSLIRSATIEMFRPIASSTIVTVAVFAPLIFVGGMVGELFMPFALTMTFALSASLLVAITIVPALSHTLFKKKLYSPKQEKSFKKPGKIVGFYRRVLNWSLNHKVITSLIAVVMLVGSLMLTPFIGFSFMGSDEEKVLYLTYKPEPGELKKTTLDNVGVIEQKMLSRKDVDMVQVSIMDHSDQVDAMMGGVTNGALMYVIFDSETENFSEIASDIENDLKDLQQSGTWSSQNFSSGDTANNELNYTLYSEDLERLNEAVAQVEKIMEESDHLKDVSSSMEESFDEFVLQVEQEKLIKHGLTTSQIAMLLNPHSTKEVLTTLKKDGEDLQVIVQKDVNVQTSIDELLKQEVPTMAGETMKLSEIVEVEKGTTPNTLERSEGKFYASVTGTIIGNDLSKATTEIDHKLTKTKLPKGVDMDIAGVAADMQETFIQLIVAMIAAIAIVYLILVVTFSEGLAPFAILFSLPFTVIGSFVGLLIAGETISVPVMMGLLMLIGIVVTNAIVLVDRMIRMERGGMDLREAILEAGATRLRPILMTALATIGALIPLAMGSEGSGLISKGLGISVIGGLTSSTLLTLIIVPIVYEVLSKLFKKDRNEMKGSNKSLMSSKRQPIIYTNEQPPIK